MPRKYKYKGREQEYKAAYRSAHKTEIAAYKKAWRSLHREEIREYAKVHGKAYRITHRCPPRIACAREARSRKRLSAYYVRSVLRRHSSCKNVQYPRCLVELKRAHLTVLRTLKENAT